MCPSVQLELGSRIGILPDIAPDKCEKPLECQGETTAISEFRGGRNGIINRE
jgi:hypothetical protein